MSARAFGKVVRQQHALLFLNPRSDLSLFIMQPMQSNAASAVLGHFPMIYEVKLYPS